MGDRTHCVQHKCLVLGQGSVSSLCTCIQAGLHEFVQRETCCERGVRGPNLFPPLSVLLVRSDRSELLLQKGFRLLGGFEKSHPVYFLIVFLLLIPTGYEGEVRLLAGINVDPWCAMPSRPAIPLRFGQFTVDTLCLIRWSSNFVT